MVSNSLFILKTNKMTTIIRVEHPFDNKGIWRSEEGGWRSELDNLFERHSTFNPNGMNPPTEDGITNFTKEHYCAYKSIKHIQKWIMPEEFKVLIENFGFKVLMIDVQECIEGLTQCAFKREHVLQTKDISSLFI